ncbi:hypothetical protein Mapa_012547 [Marchantia paleacea]|nr:hypothetical protein Mapa_012547 [Marchantia paleacea]
MLMFHFHSHLRDSGSVAHRAAIQTVRDRPAVQTCKIHFASYCPTCGWGHSGVIALCGRRQGPLDNTHRRLRLLLDHLLHLLRQGLGRRVLSYARAAFSGVGNVPSQTRTPFSGSRISAAHLPQGRRRTPRKCLGVVSAAAAVPAPPLAAHGVGPAAAIDGTAPASTLVALLPAQLLLLRELLPDDRVEPFPSASLVAAAATEAVSERVLTSKSLKEDDFGSNFSPPGSRTSPPPAPSAPTSRIVLPQDDEVARQQETLVPSSSSSSRALPALPPPPPHPPSSTPAPRPLIAKKRSSGKPYVLTRLALPRSSPPPAAAAPSSPPSSKQLRLRLRSHHSSPPPPSPSSLTTIVIFGHQLPQVPSVHNASARRLRCGSARPQLGFAVLCSALAHLFVLLALLSQCWGLGLALLCGEQPVQHRDCKERKYLLQSTRSSFFSSPKPSPADVADAENAKACGRHGPAQKAPPRANSDNAWLGSSVAASSNFSRDGLALWFSSSNFRGRGRTPPQWAPIVSENVLAV